MVGLVGDDGGSRAAGVQLGEPKPRAGGKSSLLNTVSELGKTLLKKYTQRSMVYKKHLLRNN